MVLTTSEIKKLSLKDGDSVKTTRSWVELLGLSETDKTLDHVREALTFFKENMPTLTPEMAFSFIKAMDLSCLVKSKKLAKGTKLLAFRSQTESKFKLFYTRSGANPYTIGISPKGRVAVQYVVSSDHVWALESRSSGVVDVWSFPANAGLLSVSPINIVLHGEDKGIGTMVSGGGTQLIIPSADQHLTVSSVGTHVHGDDDSAAARTQQRRNK